MNDKFYRFNLKLSPKLKEDLKEIAWEERKSVTKVINEAIEYYIHRKNNSVQIPISELIKIMIDKKDGENNE